jgi:hypothetical protein
MMILTPTRSNHGAKRWNTAAGPNLVPMGLTGYHASQTATFYLDDMYFARGAASSNPTGPAATIFSQCSLGGQTTPVACGQATSGAIGLSGSAGATNTVNSTAVDPNLIIPIQQVTDNSAIAGSPTGAAPALSAVRSARSSGTSFSFTSVHPASVQCLVWQINPRLLAATQ